MVEFIERAQPLGAELKELAAPLVGPKGETTVRYLERDDAGRIRRTEPLPESEDERLGPDALRRLCRQLGLDPRELDLGLDLG